MGRKCACCIRNEVLINNFPFFPHVVCRHSKNRTNMSKTHTKCTRTSRVAAHLYPSRPRAVESGCVCCKIVHTRSLNASKTALIVACVRFFSLPATGLRGNYAFLEEFSLFRFVLLTKFGKNNTCVLLVLFK